MKAIFPRAELLRILQVVARATATRSAIQSLAGVLLNADENEIWLSATDTEIGLRARADGTIERAGSLLLPGRLIVDILRVLDGETVSIEYQADKGQAEVVSGQARFAVKTLAVEDFPRLPAAPDATAMKVPAEAFARAIERVARAASRDETRPVLTGILVSVSGQQLRMVATDSYRLSVREAPLDKSVTGEFEANVPARALQELSRIVSDASVEEISAAVQDNQIVFATAEVILSSRMIEGQFPNYQQLLPESYEHEVALSRSEILGAVRRIGLMAQRNAPLRLKLEDGAMAISAQTPDVGEAAETLPVPYSAEPLEIGFNPQFLQDGLDAAESDEFKLKLISPLRPGLIEAGGDGDGGRFLYLIMPVRLNV
jgi:DNA polymerase-3 subunit beta